MNPTIVASIIAGIVTLVSVVGTLIVARWGFQATMKAAKTTAEEAHVDTDKTLTEQREQLEKTLAEQHVRTLNERFGTAAEKLAVIRHRPFGLLGCTRWQGWLMTGKTTVRPASTCYALTCGCPTPKILEPGRRGSWLS